MSGMRTGERNARLTELSVLLKMFDIEATVHFNKGNPHNGRKTWKPYPFRVQRLYHFGYATREMFGSLSELELFVHRLIKAGNDDTFDQLGDCHVCEGGGWVQVYSPSPPAFEECAACHNPSGYPSP